MAAGEELSSLLASPGFFSSHALPGFTKAGSDNGGGEMTVLMVPSAHRNVWFAFAKIHKK